VKLLDASQRLRFLLLRLAGKTAFVFLLLLLFFFLVWYGVIWSPSGYQTIGVRNITWLIPVYTLVAHTVAWYSE
jgi:hypothetical protein